MGSVQAWISVLIGFFILGAAFIFTQPLFDFLFALGSAMGGNAQHTAEFINSALRYVPIPLSLSMILWGVIEATSHENTGGYR